MEQKPDKPANVQASVTVERTSSMDWVKLAIGGGLGAMLALSGWNFLTSESRENSAFMRTTIKDNTSALTKVEAAIQAQVTAASVNTAATQQQTAAQVAATNQQTAAISNLAEKIEDLTDASKDASRSTKNLTSEISEQSQETDP